jgi:N-methylhydantoinase A/oxoprolinase/acetone carboxylase beta subunit
VGSAIGLLAAAPRVDVARSYYARIDDRPNWAAIDALFEEMRQEALAVLATSGVEPDDARIETSADLRYLGQAHQLPVRLPSRSSANRAAELISAFEVDYARVYGRIPPGVGVQALLWRLTATGPAPETPGPAAADVPVGLPRSTVRSAVFGAGVSDATVIARGDLAIGQTVVGPAFIEEDASTIVVPPGWSAAVLPSRHIDMRRGAHA